MPVGEIVHVSPSRNVPGGSYEVIMQLPERGGEVAPLLAYPQLYALTPVAWSAANNATRTYGSVNPNTFPGPTYGGPA
jgi:hypothetical protein